MTNLELETVTILVAIAINLPFGAYRATVRRFSWQWFVAVHLPIPLFILMRLSFGLGWWFVPFILASALTGQPIAAPPRTPRKSRRLMSVPLLRRIIVSAQTSALIEAAISFATAT